MAVEGTTPVSPIPIPELTKITNDACDDALKTVTEYEHTAVSSWNSAIINTVLKALIAATTPSDSTKPAPYRFTVNSTIVQQGMIDKSAAAQGAQSNAGKRGMHSASGAFWDVNRDGMWTFKYPGAEERGLDVVVSVTWFAMT
ncbi:dynein light chain (Tctex1) [Penicillium sp. IBT 18751x]|uniref:dynein light chain (Tctex1) n=1 Tax=Penicillium maclennaniae TaxID=1343394 RepID=UPI0025408113|nr:dynein light chain (Tctex1) [Penicillium maclennaniae]KAJ5684709.1 dynein light chain (Tctex1) [Penicillium maclennaniae]KAJ6131121.1 dynein light chain (Tctex1) [Penicillium sp. IBT 18751x]